MDSQAEKFSIKNMLFSKIIPNYVIPIPTKGYKVYGCTDCGDKFLLQSSYEYHINRKSLQITFMCRICNTRNVFYNRCTLLSHIRGHAFKTATININDIIIEPLPLSHFKIENGKTVAKVNRNANTKNIVSNCYECKAPLKGRPLVVHFMKYQEGQSFMCPLCPFTIPTICGLQCHIRLHIGKPPFICPECGWCVQSKMALKHNNHQCLGFKILRGNTRFRCEAPDCNILYHPDHHNVHLTQHHVKKVYKCPLCVVACFSGSIMDTHMKLYHPANPETTALIFYQCDLCPERLVLENQLDNHLTGHEGKYVYPCRTCGDAFFELLTLIKHYIDFHGQNNSEVTKVLNTILSSSKDIYSVVKKCEKCQRYFKYKCNYNEIDNLPTDCPFKCYNARIKIQNVADEFENNNFTFSSSDTVKCYLCNLSIPENWADIKKHFYYSHRNIKCVDVKVNLSRIDVTNKNKKKHKIEKSRTQAKHKKRKRNSKSNDKNDVSMDVANKEDTGNNNTLRHICKKCDKAFDTKEVFLEHVITHRDLYMAYQCMECGDSFAVKPSFSTHLLIQHNISNVDAYITQNQCYNEDALIKNNLNPVSKEPLKENQCNICMDEFENLDELEKHYRVHGMAFLKKNTSKSNSNSP